MGDVGSKKELPIRSELPDHIYILMGTRKEREMIMIIKEDS